MAACGRRHCPARPRPAASRTARPPRPDQRRARHLAPDELAHVRALPQHRRRPGAQPIRGLRRAGRARLDPLPRRAHQHPTPRPDPQGRRRRSRPLPGGQTGRHGNAVLPVLPRRTAPVARTARLRPRPGHGTADHRLLRPAHLARLDTEPDHLRRRARRAGSGQLLAAVSGGAGKRPRRRAGRHHQRRNPHGRHVRDPGPAAAQLRRQQRPRRRAALPTPADRPNTPRVRHAVPTPRTAAPASTPHNSGTTATTNSPRALVAKAPAANRNGRTRSGSVANRIRHVPTTAPNTSSTTLHAFKPNSAARSAPKANRTPPAGHSGEQAEPGDQRSRVDQRCRRGRGIARLPRLGHPRGEDRGHQRAQRRAHPNQAEAAPSE